MIFDPTIQTTSTDAAKDVNGMSYCNEHDLICIQVRLLHFGFWIDNQQIFLVLPKVVSGNKRAVFVMSIRSLVIVKFYCRKVAVLKIFIITSLIILVHFIVKSNWLEADMSGVFLMFPKKSLRSGFWTSFFVPCPVEPVIGFTAILTLGIIKLSMAVKIALCMRFSTVMTALLSNLKIWSSILFPVT